MELLLKPTLFAALAVVFSAGPLHAQNSRSFVSITGNDSNTCATDTAPCRSLSAAVNKTNAAGTVHCLDAGDFTNGTLQLNKSILIDCAATGGIYRAGNVAVSIGGAATDIIHIRGLKIFSAADIVITMPNPGNVGTLRIEDCDLVTNSPTFPAVRLGGASANANVFEALLVNTTISGGTAALQVQPDGGGARIAIDRVRAFNSGIGLNLIGTGATVAPNLRVAIKDSTISGNTSQGIRAASTGGLTRVLLQNSMVTQNATGLQADGAQAVIHVVGSTIIHNGTGLSAVNGGGLVSFGTNVVVAPVTANGAFTATTTLK